MIHLFPDDKETSSELDEVLRQLLNVLTECVSQPMEVISRLGCSCIRYVAVKEWCIKHVGFWFSCKCCLTRVFINPSKVIFNN